MIDVARAERSDARGDAAHNVTRASRFALNPGYAISSRTLPSGSTR